MRYIELSDKVIDMTDEQLGMEVEFESEGQVLKVTDVAVYGENYLDIGDGEGCFPESSFSPEDLKGNEYPIGVKKGTVRLIG